MQMNVPQRQEEILMQMCVEINGVVITNRVQQHTEGKPQQLFHRGKGCLRIGGKAGAGVNTLGFTHLVYIKELL